MEVVQKLQGLQMCFAKMLTGIRQSFAKCDHAEMRFFLDAFLGADEFKNCTTIDEILRQLQLGLIDTFNTYCLEQFAVQFQNDEARKLIAEYNEKKEAFLNETVVTEFQKAIFSLAPMNPALPQEKAVITVKIPESLARERTLKDMEKLAGRAFGEYYRSFINLRVIPGSIIIIWFFPKTLKEKLEEAARTKKAVFRQEGVEEVTVAGRVVFHRNSEQVGT